MNDVAENNRQATRIIAILAKFQAGLEISQTECPLCTKKLAHEEDCPIGLAWNLLDEKHKEMAKAKILELASEHFNDDSNDTFDWPDYLDLTDLFDNQ